MTRIIAIAGLACFAAAFAWQSLFAALIGVVCIAAAVVFAAISA